MSKGPESTLLISGFRSIAPSRHDVSGSSDHWYKATLGILSLISTIAEKRKLPSVNLVNLIPLYNSQMFERWTVIWIKIYIHIETKDRKIKISDMNGYKKISLPKSRAYRPWNSTRRWQPCNWLLWYCASGHPVEDSCWVERPPNRLCSDPARSLRIRADFP